MIAMIVIQTVIKAIRYSIMIWNKKNKDGVIFIFRIITAKIKIIEFDWAIYNESCYCIKNKK